ncbi:MAG: hypothetical protein ACYC7J_11550 [Syntrophales bacterium]
MKPHPDTLLIFDYSGTLSLEMPRFAGPVNLRRALARSGLAVLGVTGPEVFWEGIVNPTWVEGSTTRAGYGRVMAERIAVLGLAPAAAAGEVAAAAARFVAHYLEESRIAPGWRPLLTRLSERQNVGVIIATDHYAEATGKIIAELEAWGIPAEPVERASPRCPGDTGGAPARRPIIVANSADLGSWKTDPAFWEALRAKCPGERVRRLLVVDDFGFNEAAGDGYGAEPAKTAARQEQTRVTLRRVFQVEAEIIPFPLAEGQADEDGGAQLIADTVDRVEGFLAEQ